MTDLLTVSDVATRTGLSEYKVRELARERVVDCVRSNPTTGGGHIRFTEEQYEGLLRALTVPAKQATPAKARKPRKRRAS